jgi:hypothetical protein
MKAGKERITKKKKKNKIIFLINYDTTKKGNV